MQTNQEFGSTDQPKISETRREARVNDLCTVYSYAGEAIPARVAYVMRFLTGAKKGLPRKLIVEAISGTLPVELFSRGHDSVFRADVGEYFLDLNLDLLPENLKEA